jgi:putative lipase involved disintegration of autophagic bodies
MQYDPTATVTLLRRIAIRIGLFITGHSLGGALANLMAADIHSRKSLAGKVPGASIMTFGAPRVFDQKTGTVSLEEGMTISFT